MTAGEIWRINTPAGNWCLAEGVELRRIADNLSGLADAGSSATARGFTLIELLVVIAIISLLAAIALPSYYKIKAKAKEAEVKSGLHNIQLELERWAVDHEGTYPEYLIGGDKTIHVGSTDSNNDASGYTAEVPAAGCSDLMLREGYVTCYPRNPFVRDGRAVYRMQRDIGDALRNGSTTGALYGTRFGASGAIMGQVLCDARWISREYTVDYLKRNIIVQTYSSIQYEFYDIWLGNLQKPFLPGSFMYKAMGDIIPSVGRTDHLTDMVAPNSSTAVQLDTLDKVTYPISLTRYILSAWGGFHTKGMDVLGEEPLVVFSYSGTRRIHGSSTVIFNPATGAQMSAPGVVDTYSMLGVPPWTRGVNRSHVGPLWGSPFGAGKDGEQLGDGNPNGMRDALIIVLTAGEDRNDGEQ
jgi:prepilin-type N-terminal cleavage/methylation domain-containing protein